MYVYGVRFPLLSVITLSRHMSFHSSKKRMAAATLGSCETVKEALLLAVPGENRRSKDDLVHGFRVLSDGKQIASAYFSDNSADNQVEFALNFRLFDEDVRIHAAVKCWFEFQKAQLGNRQVNIHQRGDPVDWFRIGFESVEEALEFLQQLRSERHRIDKAVRWSVDRRRLQTDTIEPLDPEPEADTQLDGDPEARTTLHGEWMLATARMVATAESTILQSSGDPALKSIKVKQCGFGSREEFERYVLGLIVTQGGRCAISELPLQRDDSYSDAEMLASLDRIDSAGHYAPGNLQVVCRFINRWKGADDNALFLRLLGELRRAPA